MSIVVIWKGRAFWPSMTRVASEMKLQFMVLEMKGKEREALRGSDGVDASRASGFATAVRAGLCEGGHVLVLSPARRGPDHGRRDGLYWC